MMAAGLVLVRQVWAAFMIFWCRLAVHTLLIFTANDYPKQLNQTTKKYQYRSGNEYGGAQFEWQKTDFKSREK